MNTNYLMLLILFIFLSCSKTKGQTAPSFIMKANRQVDIPISSELKATLDYLANYSVDIEKPCAKNKYQTYTVDFYFKIDQNVKNLIIIQEYNNPCNEISNGTTRKLKKSIIPIEKINNLVIVNLMRINVPEDMDEIRQFNITMEYRDNSIDTEYMERRVVDNKEFFTENKSQEKLVYFELTEKEAIELKEILTVLVNEIKNKH